MASKSWPRRISEKSSVPRSQLRRCTDPIVRSDRTQKTRESEESLERASKRTRRSQSPGEGCSQAFSRRSSRTHSSGSSSTYTDAPEMPEETQRLSRSISEAEFTVEMKYSSNRTSSGSSSTYTDAPEMPEEAEFGTVGVKTSNEKKRSRGHSNPAEDDQEPKNRSRKTPSPSEGPSHWACSSDSLRKRSRKTPSPSEGPSHWACSSDSLRKRSRKTPSPSEGPSHWACSSDCLRKRSRKTPSPSEGPSYPALSNVRPSKSIAAFKKRYSVEEMLGKGSYGSVFAGERKRDNLPVAIKEISQKDVERTPVLVDGNITMVPLEVALLLTLKPAESESSAVVTLLDWFDLEDVLILVLERPDPCMGMYDYIYRKQHRIKEHEAKIMIRQLVDALIEIHSKGVFHGDIKADNILIETSSDVPRVRVIDFGIGTFVSGETLNTYAEREVFLCSPPEMWENRTFQAEPTTVWQLGLVAYEILHRRLPFQSGFGIMRKSIRVNGRLSVDCQNFIENCLKKNPDNRPTLAMLKNDPWLM